MKIVNRFRGLQYLASKLFKPDKMPTSTIAEVAAKKQCLELKSSESEPRSVLKFVKMSEKAHAPTKGSPLAAGYDLYSAIDKVCVLCTLIVVISRSFFKSYLLYTKPSVCVEFRYWLTLRKLDVTM